MTTLFSATHTTFTNESFLQELYIAWKNLTGNIITQPQATLVWAKYSHETGGGEYTWNYNIGNIKYMDNYLGNADGYMMLHNVWETVDGQKISYNPPSPQTWFRAYNQLSSGISDYLDLLNTSRYKGAFEALLAGNLELYAQKLHDEGYYTDTVANYSAGLKRWSAQFPVADWNAMLIEMQAIKPVVQPTTQPATQPAVVNTLPVIEIIGNTNNNDNSNNINSNNTNNDGYIVPTNSNNLLLSIATYVVNFITYIWNNIRNKF